MTNCCGFHARSKFGRPPSLIQKGRSLGLGKLQEQLVGAAQRKGTEEYSNYLDSEPSERNASEVVLVTKESRRASLQEMLKAVPRNGQGDRARVALLTPSGPACQTSFVSHIHRNLQFWHKCKISMLALPSGKISFKLSRVFPTILEPANGHIM